MAVRQGFEPWVLKEHNGFRNRCSLFNSLFYLTFFPLLDTLLDSGGERGIRTPDTFARMLVFETSAFDHSATSPHDHITFYYFCFS